MKSFAVEYLSNEVTEHMCPVVRDFFIHVYEHPENFLEATQESHSPLIKFQYALKKIPNWTNTQIKKQIDEITTRCSWFKQLLVGLFVSYVNMISDGIRTSSRGKRLHVKLPSDETFVHTCFVTCANDLYEDPYVMKEPEKKRDAELDKRLYACILKSIRKLIPTREILNEHIPISNDTVCLNDDSMEMEDEPKTMEEPKTIQEEPKTIQEEQIQDSGPKTIPVSGDEKPDLFPDAPEDKKLMSDDEEETKIEEIK